MHAWVYVCMFTSAYTRNNDHDNDNDNGSGNHSDNNRDTGTYDTLNASIQNTSRSILIVNNTSNFLLTTIPILLTRTEGKNDDGDNTTCKSNSNSNGDYTAHAV